MSRPKTTPPTDRVHQLLEAFDDLGLAAMATALREELDRGPDPDDTRLDFLWRIVEPQLRGRNQRRIERRLAAARFPASCTLEAFDWSFNPKIDRELILQLATLDFVRNGLNALCAGMPGTGKSHIAIALGHAACAAGFRVRYTTSAAMLDTLYASLATHSLQQALRPFVRADVLIIDEVGIDRPNHDHERDASLFYKVVETRYNRPSSTIVTTNIDWKDWAGYLGDALATGAILDRLVGRGYALRFEGRSYRAAQHEKLNAKTKRPGTSNRDPGAEDHA